MQAYKEQAVIQVFSRPLPGLLSQLGMLPEEEVVLSHLHDDLHAHENFSLELWVTSLTCSRYSIPSAEEAVACIESGFQVLLPPQSWLQPPYSSGKMKDPR